MLDIRFIRENFEHVKEAIDKKGETIAIDNFPAHRCRGNILAGRQFSHRGHRISWPVDACEFESRRYHGDKDSSDQDYIPEAEPAEKAQQSGQNYRDPVSTQ